MNHRKESVFVTGATGFVGSEIARSLCGSGYRVRALVRPNSNPAAVDRLRKMDAELIVGDVRNPGSYRPALKGCRYFFHGAAIHETWTRDPATLYAVNVDAVRQLLAEAESHGVEQFVFTSSIKTIGLLKGDAISDETVAYNMLDRDNHYGISKFLAEEYLLSVDTPLTIKILNPAAVIGPYGLSSPPTMAMVEMVVAGRAKAVLRTRLGLVDVRDVAQAHLLALDRAAPKERYILCAGNLTMAQLCERLARLAEVPPPRLTIPYPAAYAIAYASLGISAITRRPPLVHPHSLHVASFCPGYDGSKAALELDMDYTPLDISLRDTVAWIKNRTDLKVPNEKKKGDPK